MMVLFGLLHAGTMDASSLQALAALLKPSENKEDDETLDVTPSPYATPGSIGGPAAASKSGDPNPQSASKNIWNTEEVSEKQQYEYDDPRPCPDYDIIFKQAVGTEDVFLGMGLKNPSTACCENMVVKIKLPGSDIKDVELDITDTFLDCRTPKCRLGLHLPHKVHSKQSKAKWISDIEELHITLLMNREYDYLNK